MKIFESFTDYFIPPTGESSPAFRSRIGKFQGLISIWVNSVLFLVKFIIGILAGSISVIADAIHTLSDVVSSIVVVWGFNEADKPADYEHPYGHGRAEYIATLIIAVLLTVAGIEFIKASVNRILHPEVIHPDSWMIAVIGLTILVKELIARYATYLSEKITSGTLYADAWHHRSDAISSFMVLVAMVAGKFGYNSIDGWAGLGVALFLIYTGWAVARDAVDDLIGKPPTFDDVERIRKTVMEVDGVLGAHDIIIHSYGHDKFVSIHVEIDSEESTDRAHDISENVETKLGSLLNVEPTVHVDPVKPGSPLVRKVNEFIAAHWLKDKRVINVHDIRIVETEEHNVILFGINLKSDLSKVQVAKCCQEIETSVQKAFNGFEVQIKVSPIHRF
ncbi:MAG: cation diffusion facilitator family transporter [Fidelibacterota bacterium]